MVVYNAFSEPCKPLCISNDDYSYTIFMENGEPVGYYYHEFHNDQIVREKTIVHGRIPAEYLQAEERARL